MGNTFDTHNKDWADRPAVKWFINLTMVALLALVGYLAYQRYYGDQNLLLTTGSDVQAAAVSVTEEKDEAAAVEPAVDLALPGFSNQSEMVGMVRRIEARTTIPSRPRDNVITYTVQAGDTLFAIADQYGLKPETILWGNFDTLKDNPHLLSKDMVLNILPVNGTYYKWKNGDSLGAVSASFNVDQQAILDFSGNHFDLTKGPQENWGLEPGFWLVVPGGSRPLKDWGPPAITRKNPAAARYYGSGSCGSVYEGAVGSGTFTWPTANRSISGYNYSGIHPAIDIGGSVGDGIFASDSGVVVYAGWSEYGYGYLIVVDHGNGFQTAYAHLSAVAVTCGQSVFQGGYIGGLGSTGNSTGPHLHFEIVYNGAKPNPFDFLP